MNVGDRVRRRDTGECGYISSIHDPQRPGGPTLARMRSDGSNTLTGFVALGVFEAEAAPVTAVEAEGYEVEVEAEIVEETPELEPWPVKTPPARYLERWPDGKYADLARAHVG